jgi:hypothetical protein
MSMTISSLDSKTTTKTLAKLGRPLLSLLYYNVPKHNQMTGRLNELLVMAKTLPGSDKEVLDARTQLSDAIDGILDCTSDTKKRFDLVSEAEKLYQDLKKTLTEKQQEIEKQKNEGRNQAEAYAFGLGPQATEEQLRNAREAADQRRKLLLQQITEIEQKIAEKSDLFSGMRLEYPVKDEAALEMQIASLHKHLNEDIISNKRGFELTELIVNTGKEVTASIEQYEKAYEATDQIRSNLSNLQYDEKFASLIKAFASKDDFANSKIGAEVELLWRKLNSIPISFTPVQNSWSRIEVEWEKAAKDIEAYAGATKSTTSEDIGKNSVENGITEKQVLSSEWQTRFDTDMREKIKTLEAALAPLGRQSPVFEDRDRYRAYIRDEDTFKTACKFLTIAIDTAIKAAADALDKILKEYEDLSSRLHTKYEAVKKLSNGKSVFAADRKLIDVMLGTFDQAKPKEGSQPDRQLCLDIEAALKLGHALEQKQDDLLGMKDAANAFSEALKRVKKAFNDNGRAGETSHLADYFPDFYKEKQKDLAKIETDKNKLGAKKALELIVKLESELDTKIKEANASAEEIGNSKTEEWKDYFSLSSGNRLITDIENVVMTPVLNVLKVDTVSIKSGGEKLELLARGSSGSDSVQVYAYEAVVAAKLARPFDIEAFREKEKIFSKTVQGLSGALDLKKDHESTADLRKPELEWKERQLSALKDRYAKLNARYTFIASRLSKARAEASDKNAIKQADLMKKICKTRLTDFNPDMLKRIDRAFKDRVTEKALQAKSKTDDGKPLDAIEKTLREAIANAEMGMKAVLERFSTCVAGLELRPEGQMAAKLTELPKLIDKWNTTLQDAKAQVRDMAQAIGDYAADVDDKSYQATLTSFQTELNHYADTIAGTTPSLQSAAMKLIDTTKFSDEIRRKARETALSEIGARRMVIQGHPLSTILLTRPYAFGDVCLLPKRICDQLATLEFTVLTAV